MPHDSPTAARADMMAAGGDRHRLLIGVSIVLIGFNLRIAVISLSPVLPDVMRDTGISAFGASLLTTLPPLAFGLFGPLAPALARRLGSERAVLATIATLVAGTTLRGLGGAMSLYLGQIVAMLSIGGLNVLLSGLTKRHFPHRLALLTGFYSMAIACGAAVAAGATIPLRNATGGSWSAALALWGLPALASLVLWLASVPRRAAADRMPAPARRGLWRDRIAWNLTLFMGLQAALAYTVFGWLPTILRSRGLDPVTAGLVLSVSVIIQAAAAFVAPALATRGRDQRLITAALSVLCTISLLGCLLAPIGSIWLWSVLLGIAQGAMFAITLTMIVLRAPDQHVAAELSGMVQSIGYLVGACGPLLAGLLHDWTGSWHALVAPITLCGAGMVVTGLGAGHARHVGVPRQASR